MPHSPNTESLTLALRWTDANPGREAFYYEWSGARNSVKWTRAGFLKHWNLKEIDVPLLKLNRHNFEQPFSPG